MSYPFDRLASAERAYIEAPAGCGKTFAIAHAVSLSKSGKQLVLTHTHAGVASLRNKLRQLQVPANSYHIDTIAGWCQGLVESYPLTSGYTRLAEKVLWNSIYQKAAALISHHFIQRVIKASYAGVYVDEYQDCTQLQHLIILGLAELLPCRILGDPLQAIFGFDKNDPLINWDTHVINVFERLPPLEVPWRWKEANSKLGETLIALREPLSKNQPIDVSTGPIIWRKLGEDKGLAQCFEVMKRKGSIVVICSTENQCHNLAKRTGGHYKSIETIECNALLEAADNFEQKRGVDRAQKVVDFIEDCTSGAGTFIRPLLNTRIRPSSKNAKLKLMIQSILHEIRDSESTSSILLLLKAAPSIPDVRVARLDLWEEMKRTLSLYQSGKYPNLKEAAIFSRNQTRALGRRVDYRTISRTLLVKGLEFDHVLLIVDGRMTKENIYVALTRGTRSLTVASASSLLIPKEQSFDKRGTNHQLGFEF